MTADGDSSSPGRVTLVKNLPAVWRCEDAPERVGWYPVLRCFEPKEGLFPGGAFWNGAHWTHPEFMGGMDHTVVASIEELCADEEDAEDLAYHYDPIELES